MAFYALPGGIPVKTPEGSTLVLSDGVVELTEDDYVTMLDQYEKNRVIRDDIARMQAAQENAALSTLREAAMNKLTAGTPLTAEEAQAIVPKLYAPGPG